MDAHFTKTSELRFGLWGGHYGRRAHEKWREFFDNVNDVVPLNVINRSTKDKETNCGESICVRLVDHSSWLQSYSWEEIKTAQRDDEELSILLDWAENKVEPGNY